MIHQMFKASLFLGLVVAIGCGGGETTAGPAEGTGSAMTETPAADMTAADMTAADMAAADMAAAPSGGGGSNFDDISISTGFMPDPMAVTGTSGGSRDGTTITDADGSPCAGWIAGTPDHLLNLGTDFANLRVMAYATDAESDTTLVIQKPDGAYLCNDDSEDGFHPAITGAMPAGTYKVWVGSYNEGEHVAYRLGVTEIMTNTASSLAN